MRYVSKILRSKITEAKTQDQFAQKVYLTDHDNEIKKNFWGYVKFYIEKPKRIIPNFDKKTCFDYFVKSFKCINPLKQFQIPSWIPTFREPSCRFDLNPPPHTEICKVIKQMKSKGSPCPLDQISIICFKKCPYLRTYITTICAKVWETNHIPYGILEESSQYINLQKACHRQSSELLTNYSPASRIKNLYVISTQENKCILM